MRSLVGVIVVTGLLSWTIGVEATEVVPLTIQETVRDASAIAVVTVRKAASRWGDDSHRWMRTDMDLYVEDAILPGADVISGRVVTVSFWGGTIGDETMAVAGLTLPAVGDRLVLMFNTEGEAALTPAVGLTQGMFRIVRGAGDGVERVVEWDGSPLRPSVVSLLSAGTDASAIRRTGAPLSGFVSALQTNLAEMKATPKAPVREAAQTLPRLPYETPDRRDDAPADAGPALETTRPRSAAPFTGGPADPRGASDPHDAVAVSRQAYSVVGRAAVPIVINQLPASFAPWSPADQQMMSNWNYYADIFRVLVTPTGTYGWPNGRFDLDGFPTDADLARVYGSGYGGALAVTFLRYSGNTIIEADVAFNPGYAWTLNDEAIYNGTTAHPFRLTMLHELGHVFGAQHNFGGLSVMNYAPSAFRFFGLPYMDDAEAIRVVYGGPARADLGIHMYYSSGTQSFTDATYPAQVQAGQTFTVSRFHLENSGTVTLSPTIQWYLTPARNFNSYVYLGSTSYSALGRFTYFTPSSIAAGLSVPSNTAPGNYYLAAYIASDGGPTQGSFPFGNNFAFSRLRIRVDAPPPAAPVLLAPSGTVTVASPTYSWTAVSSATWYQLWVADSVGTKVDQWYTAAQVGCGSGTGTCGINPGVALASGTARFRVRAWNSAGYSPWTAERTFTVSLLRAQVIGVWPVPVTSIGGVARLWANVQNTGAGALPAGTQVWFWVSGPGWSGTNWVGYADMSSLAAGATRWGSFDWSVPASASPGQYTYWAQVFYGSAISPWSAGQAFTVRALTAVVDNVWPVSGATRGAAAVLWAQVRNTSSVAMPAGTTVWFYVDGPGWTGSHWVGYTLVQGLAAGGSQWYAFSWTVPAGASPGAYQYWAQVWTNTAISPYSAGQPFTVR
jgi:hypothetical protein